MRRVVVTGMGLVSPLGCGVELAWQRLLAGRSGLSRLPDAVTEGIAAKVAGRVPDAAQDPEGGWDDLENAGEDDGGDGDGHDEARQEPNLRVDARDDRERDHLGDERERHTSHPAPRS